MPHTCTRADADGDQLSDGGGSLPRALSKQSSARRGGRGDPFGPDSPLGDWSLQLKDLQFVKRPDGSDWHLGAGSYGNVRRRLRELCATDDLIGACQAEGHGVIESFPSLGTNDSAGTKR